MSRIRIIAPVVLAALSLCAFSAAAHAVVLDAANDFVSTYTGAKGGDLDVLSTDVVYDGTNISLTATMNGAIGTTQGAIYVWGLDRGKGATTANFASIGLPNVIFDSVVVLRPDTTVSVFRIAGGGSATGTAVISGNTISASIPASTLPTQGFAVSDYTWNLWPRISGGSDANVSDFAPNANNAAITVVPEVGSATLLMPAILTALGVVVVRRRKSV